LQDKTMRNESLKTLVNESLKTLVGIVVLVIHHEWLVCIMYYAHFGSILCSKNM